MNILPSSSGLGGVHLDRIQRLVHIVRNQGGSIYINSAGGRQLYKTDDFLNQVFLYDFLIPPFLFILNLLCLPGSIFLLSL